LGGYNSGRAGWRGVVEQRKRLDIRRCRKQGWLRVGASGWYNWTWDGEPWGSVSYAVRDGALELSWRITSSDDENVSFRTTVPIKRVPCRFGGERLYWHCPSCYRNCEVIVMANTARFWGCRRCLKLRYSCQGHDAATRMQRRADAIYARLGDTHDDGLVYKPKWMRWKTFNRLMDTANELAENADAFFALRIMRIAKFLPAHLR
jgi:hypothetical protein